MLEVRQLFKSYGSLPIVKGVNLQVTKGEIVSIVGASGAGKSTLLHMIGTLDRPDQGEILINDIAINQLQAKALSAFRNTHIGFIFQFHHLLPEFTALENVCMPGWIANKSAKEVEGRAKHLLDLLGLSHRLDHAPSALSGGEAQRVAVARALINTPSIVLADEPSGNLDSENAEALHLLFEQLRDELGQTFVVVTHNQALAQRSDRILQMKDGVIIE
jgi:lipoprotein-releasing system ATP-binding protein